VKLKRFWFHLSTYNLVSTSNVLNFFSPPLTFESGLYTDIEQLCSDLSDSNWEFSYDSSKDRVSVTNNSSSQGSIGEIGNDPNRAIFASMLGIGKNDLASSIAKNATRTFELSPEVYPFRLFYLFMKPFGNVSSNETSGNASDGFCFPLPIMGSPPSTQYYEPFVSMEFFLERPERNVNSFVVWMVDEYGRNVDLDSNFWAIDLIFE
jgi:hypothetical protein